MKGLLVFVGMSLGGGVGWWLGAFVGFGTAAILSGIFSGLGVWATRWLMREYLD